jgi:hypothetical protein
MYEDLGLLGAAGSFSFLFLLLVEDSLGINF